MALATMIMRTKFHIYPANCCQGTESQNVNLMVVSQEDRESLKSASHEC